MAHVAEETVESLRLDPHEQVQQRTVGQIVEVPQFAEETVESLRLDPHERVQQRTVGQIVEVPQFAEETVELVRLDPQELAQWIDEQVVEVFSGKEEFLTQTHELKMQTHGGCRNQGSRARSESGWFDPCLLNRLVF